MVGVAVVVIVVRVVAPVAEVVGAEAAEAARRWVAVAVVLAVVALARVVAAAAVVVAAGLLVVVHGHVAVPVPQVALPVAVVVVLRRVVPLEPRPRPVRRHGAAAVSVHGPCGNRGMVSVSVATPLPLERSVQGLPRGAGYRQQRSPRAREARSPARRSRAQ